MKARIKFSKCGSMRFIGHLDVMRYFQKAFRRAHIPVSYSKGYSPHQILSFTSPLGIGLTSDAEYMDMELEECPEPERMVDWINSQMNDEIRVKDFVLLPDDSKPSMAMLAGCDYLVALKPDKVSVFRDRADMELVLADFLAQPEILVTKKTKRSEKQVDIKPNIYCQLTAGSVLNIKPELVMQALCQFVDTPYDPLDYQIHRLEMYGDANGKKGEIHLLHDEVPCELVPLSEYQK